MTVYEKHQIDGKTVFVPKDQEAQPVVPNRPPVKKPPHAPKRVGKRFGERKSWY